MLYKEKLSMTKILLLHYLNHFSDFNFSNFQKETFEKTIIIKYGLWFALFRRDDFFLCLIKNIINQMVSLNDSSKTLSLVVVKIDSVSRLM